MTLLVEQEDWSNFLAGAEQFNLNTINAGFQGLAIHMRACENLQQVTDLGIDTVLKVIKSFIHVELQSRNGTRMHINSMTNEEQNESKRIEITIAIIE